MINVLHIHTLPVISGSGINTFLSMKGLNRRTYTAELACAPGGRLIELVSRHHMKVHLFRDLVQPIAPVRDVSAILRLTLFLRKNRYHIVHSHNSKAGFIGRLAARLAGIPVIIHTVHGFAFHDQESVWHQILFRNLERLAAHWCDKMIFISQPLIDWAIREKIAHRDKITKIYSGIEFSRFTPVQKQEALRLRKKWHLDQRDKVVGIVSKLWDGKGHAILIEAFRALRRELKEVKLVIVGEGYLMEGLIRMVERYGLGESVVFTGFQMNVSDIIATFDVAVLPSLFEGMGRVLLEAMAMEKPVVASRVGGIPDLVEDGKNGFLVRAGDASDLAEALKRALSDKKLAEKMGREGRRRVKEHFSAEGMVESIEKVYTEILRKKGIPVGG